MRISDWSSDVCSSDLRLYEIGSAMQKVHDIPVLHDIALALGAQLASLACLGLAAQRDIIGKSDGFGADEALLEIAVDLARRLGRGRALVDGPRARLLRPDGKEGQQVEQLVSGADHARQPGFVQPHLLQEQQDRKSTRLNSSH